VRSRQIIGISISAAYLLFLVAIYFYIPFGDPGYEYGGLRLILYTLPWSLAGQVITLIGAIAPSQIGEAVSFFVFVVLCGGANAYIIMRLSGYRLGPQAMRTIAGFGCVAAIAAQVTAGPREQAAREYHWPPNVPKTAFLVPHFSGGWYQGCDFDPDTQRNHCHIWNFGGETLYDEEFVPYDAGRPVAADQLKIVDRNSGPDRVTLENGQILIPKSRQADLRKFLDGVSPRR
jgi:hypothetical protein